MDVPRMLQFFKFWHCNTTDKCQFCDYMFYGHSNVFLLWASIERYILVFHGNIFNTAKRRLYIHYLPFLAINFYLTLFYTIVMFLIPCDQFDFSVVINILLSITLGIRVFRRNRVVIQQNAQRKKHRKMVLQLLLISSLYIACVLSYALLIFIQVVTGPPDFAAYVQNIYFYYLFWLLTLLKPFVCIGCLPEVVRKIKQWWQKQLRRNTVLVPVNTS